MSKQTGLSAARMSMRWQLRRERERIIIEDRDHDGEDDPYGPLAVDKYIELHSNGLRMSEAETNVTVREIDFEKRASEMMRAMRRSRNA
jgi:hypothetical protein